MYKLDLTKHAAKDAEIIDRNALKTRAFDILNTVRENPYKQTHGFEKLKGTKKPTFSRRIDGSYRFVYMVLPNTDGLKDPNGETYEGIVKVLRMWSHSTKK